MIFPSPKEASFPEHSWQPTGASRLTSQKKDATDRRRKLLPRTGQSLQFEMGFFFFLSQGHNCHVGNFSGSKWKITLRRRLNIYTYG